MTHNCAAPWWTVYVTQAEIGLQLEWRLMLRCLYTTLGHVRLEVFTAVTIRMVSSGMLRRVAHVRTDVSEELSASFIRVTRIGDEGGATFLRNVGSYKSHAA
jgi:hypothetical protein